MQRLEKSALDFWRQELAVGGLTSQVKSHPEIVKFRPDREER